ncbi:MAG: hypothetical protein WA919_22050 [Coleofasciculaceae cyanobacterium]
MTLIRQVVKQVLETGYLNLETEQLLKQLLHTKYEVEDFNAFMNLQWAVMDGNVKQESLELLRSAHAENRQKQQANHH